METNVPGEISAETIKVTAADGFVLEAYRAKPAGPARGAVVVLQEIFGLTEQMKGVVRAYAQLGYDTIFPCVFDRAAPGTVVPFSEAPKGRDMAYGLSIEKVRLDVAAVAKAVANPHGVWLLGFCWGGGVLVDLAAHLDVAGGIAFYGTKLDTYLDQTPRCPMLFHFGETDPNSPPDLIAKLQAAYPTAETHIYTGAGHAFANDVRPTFVPAAAELARSRTLDFISRTTR